MTIKERQHQTLHDQNIDSLILKITSMKDVAAAIQCSINVSQTSSAD